MTSYTSNWAYRADIDGLRAIAILSVVIFHAASRICPGGFTGVDIFFVISGYLIGGHIYSESLRNQFSWARFYQRRAKRILPPLYVVLVVFTALCALLLSPFEFVHFARNAIAATLSASNILFWRSSNYFAPNADTNMLLMTWSLGVEEQFYLVIPLLLVLLTRIRSRMVFPLLVGLAIISFALSSFTLGRYPGAAFYLLYSRAWELLAGVGLAVYEARRARKTVPEPSWRSTVVGAIGLILISCPLWMLTPSTPFPGWAAIPSIVGSVFLIASRGGWFNRRLLSLGPLVYIGRISYSWYLWHWPLLALVRTLRGTKLPTAWSLSTLGVAFLCAVLSYYFVERPLRASRQEPVPLLLRYAVVSVMLLVCLGAILKTGGMPGRVGVVGQLDSELLKFGHPCLVGDGKSAPNDSPACAKREHPGSELAVWGDSHAAALAPAFRHISPKYGLNTMEFDKERCPPLLGVGRYYRAYPPRAEECIAFNQHVFDMVSADPAVKVVVLHAFWQAPFDPLSDDGKLVRQGQDPTQRLSPAQLSNLFVDALCDTIQKLQAKQKRVIVVGDFPEFQVDSAWRVRTAEIPIRDKVVSILLRAQTFDPGYDSPSDNDAEQKKSRQILKETIESIPGATFWDIRPAFCPRGTTCIYRDGASPFYLDSNHLSLAGALYALRGFSL